MRKLIVGVLLVSAAAGCRTTTTTVSAVTPAASGTQTGAADAATAIRGFLAAAKAQDLQGIGVYFGDRDGTARGRIPAEELEKREIIMASCLKHDRYDIISEAPGQGGSRMFVVNLVKPGKAAAINFETVLASDRRWYVQNFELDRLMGDYCRR